MTLSCDAAMSDDVLQAARAAMPADPVTAYLLPEAISQLSPRQQPLIPLLMALLDCAQSTARAINDNAYDESMPLTASLASEITEQCRAITEAVNGATECPSASGWSLPSMSGKELV